MSSAERIEAAAADWLAQAEQPEWTDADRTRLDAWLDESWDHKAAYWRLEMGWAAADRIGALGSEPEPSWFRRAWKVEAMAACLAVLAGVSVLFNLATRASPAIDVAYHTPVGGDARVTLADGTIVRLNTATAIRASISATARELTLDRGEAFFEIAHDASRPFVIHIGRRNLTVLGTKFAVRRDTDESSIAVTEGRVRLEEAEPSRDQSVVIRAGNYAVARGSSLLVSRLTPAAEQRFLAWQGGKLYFSNTRLETAAAEFNRYNRAQIAIRSREIADIRIGGAFDAKNVVGFARLLDNGLGLTVNIGDDRIDVAP